MTVDIQRTTHPFLDGRPKRMLIDGKRVEAASGKTFATLNPATGEIRWHNPLKGYGMGAPTALVSVRSDGMHLLI